MYQRYLALLEKHNDITANVCKAMGMQESTFSNWKSRYEKDPNASMTITNLKKIADYFNVPIEYFLNKDNAQESGKDTKNQGQQSKEACGAGGD